MQTTTNFQPLPAIGKPWEGIDGVYAGIVRGAEGQPDHHLVLLSATTPDCTWTQAIDWAEALNASLPTRRESAVLFGNLGDHFDSMWHWTSEQYSDPSAWVQNFFNGDQGSGDNSAELRARAVRRFPIGPSILSAGAEG